MCTSTKYFAGAVGHIVLTFRPLDRISRNLMRRLCHCMPPNTTKSHALLSAKNKTRMLELVRWRRHKPHVSTIRT